MILDIYNLTCRPLEAYISGKVFADLEVELNNLPVVYLYFSVGWAVDRFSC